tara:strand:- start:537 stop:1163 length:627 start_codon:yes stop_codon:yes gene_type:complete
MDHKLPNTIPIFPLSSAIFFPKTILPLNIFETRYIQLVNDCMKNNRLFGMVQPKSKKNLNEVYRVGCLGKIVSFNETNDKRFIITLSGIIRFRIEEEVKSEKLYREFKVNYSDFLKDLDDDQSIKVPNKDIIKKIKEFFNRNDYLIEFNELEKLNFDQMISTICMISPFSVEEKQKLIETVKIEDKISALEKIINFNLLASSNNKTIQ